MVAHDTIAVGERCCYRICRVGQFVPQIRSPLRQCVAKQTISLLLFLFCSIIPLPQTEGTSLPSSLDHFGFERFPVGPGLPVLLVYGEETYRSVCGGGIGLHNYSIVGLAHVDGSDAAELPRLFRRLKGRAVVVWPDPADERFALAREHAAMIGDAGATAVGIVRTPAGYAAEDARACADAALREAHACALPAQGAKAGRAVVPWLDVVDAGAMFAAVRGVLARYLAEPATTLDALVLWALHAWCVRGCGDGRAPFEISPRLVLAANDARADHARALRLIGWLTPSPLVVARTVAAHAVSALATEQPTLLIDDVAGGMLYRRDMRTLIAAGAQRDGLFLGAATKRNRSGRMACFAPTAIATAAALPDDLRVRAIIVPMAPAPAARARATLGDAPDEVLLLRAQMQAFAAATVVDLPAAEVLMPRAFSTASRENWAPLVAIAQAIGAACARRTIAAAQTLQAGDPAPASNLALLADIRALVPMGDGAGLATAHMIERLTADMERPWATIRRGRKLDARELADRLRTFGVRPATLRLGDDAFARGYRAADLRDAFDRYLTGVTSHVTAA
jgi:hypothetical protein